MTKLTERQARLADAIGRVVGRLVRPFADRVDTLQEHVTGAMQRLDAHFSRIEQLEQRVAELERQAEEKVEPGERRIRAV